MSNLFLIFCSLVVNGIFKAPVLGENCCVLGTQPAEKCLPHRAWKERSPRTSEEWIDGGFYSSEWLFLSPLREECANSSSRASWLFKAGRVAQFRWDQPTSLSSLTRVRDASGLPSLVLSVSVLPVTCSGVNGSQCKNQQRYLLLTLL